MYLEKFQLSVRSMSRARSRFKKKKKKNIQCIFKRGT